MVHENHERHEKKQSKKSRYKILRALTPIRFNDNAQYVVPAGIAGIQKPGMARLRSHPCVLDTGSPCRYDVLFKQSDRW